MNKIIYINIILFTILIIDIGLSILVGKYLYNDYNKNFSFEKCKVLNCSSKNINCIKEICHFKKCDKYYIPCYSTYFTLEACNISTNFYMIYYNNDICKSDTIPCYIDQKSHKILLDIPSHIIIKLIMWTFIILLIMTLYLLFYCNICQSNNEINDIEDNEDTEMKNMKKPFLHNKQSKNNQKNNNYV